MKKLLAYYPKTNMLHIVTIKRQTSPNAHSTYLIAIDKNANIPACKKF